VLSEDPAVCTRSTNSSGSLVVTCSRGNLKAGGTITQRLLLQVPETVVTSYTITAELRGDERTSDTQQAAHTDTFPAPDRSLELVSGDADKAGGCLRDGEVALSTRSGLSATNPLITTARVAGSSGQLCLPVTVRERAAASPTEACGVGATCTTDIATTEYIPVTSAAPASPVQLTFTVVATNKNMTWYKTPASQTVAVPVVDCPGATTLPSDVSACVNSRSKPTSSSVRLGVLWRAGPDPGWRG
jgi:hypothetical protein